ncbi:RNA 2',3'-cyclic phosphodiesterase [Extensimonas vulgaris]|uniref:RNA 2',3'-cyclic phosphodiesterase n=1 Tax=Extensimonas vulgaris TaxID=1031594 RepID=A0A369AU32_9BURK|nr:RNA 2',3'-cyclic phosphodiesterase [Extensimonas vulgaris]RCX11766.1 2'-5' RNA ligase [Extensimonas vulgaris]TWI40660.1 2'-5' RNA ligase [Extensimonas vulgaris]TXD15386.1 RNA 2',3'-cyclic phosphodiesterase [Extensimonas vulgaris]
MSTPAPCLPAPAAPATARLFLALWPPVGWAADLVQRFGLDAAGARNRKVPPQQIHLTLHFLGSVPRSQLPALVEGLRVPFAPFDLVFRRCERWPRGMLVALPDALPPALAALHAALGAALQRLGLPVEQRAFRPHITLARRYEAEDAQEAPVPAALASPVRWHVSRYALVESHPVMAPDAPRKTVGTRYQVLHHYNASAAPR